MKKNLLPVAILTLSLNGLVHAQKALPVESNLFIEALKTGSATAPLPEQFKTVIDEIRAETKDSGPVVLEARRISRFVQQPRCGRIGFVLAQPTSKVYWPRFGGQLNICEDGLPPWQVCEGQKALVPAGSKCKDGQSAKNTAEVDASIQGAISGGSLTPDLIPSESLGRE